jgi:hypothetical protein
LLLVGPGPADSREDDTQLPFVDFPEKVIISRRILIELCFFICRPQGGLLNRQDLVSSLLDPWTPPVIVINPLVALVVGAHKKKHQTIFIHYGQQAVGFDQIVFQAILDARFTVSGAPGELFGAFHFTGDPLLNDGFRMVGCDSCRSSSLVKMLQLSGKVVVKEQISDHGCTSIFSSCSLSDFSFDAASSFQVFGKVGNEVGHDEIECAGDKIHLLNGNIIRMRPWQSPSGVIQLTL